MTGTICAAGGHEVIIAGDGPAGCAAARVLASAGHGVLVLAPGRHMFHAGLLTPLGRERFSSIFGEPPGDALQSGPEVKGYAFHFPSQISLRADFTRGTGVHVERAAMRRFMLTASGAQVAEGAELVSARATPSGVEALARAGQQEMRLEARALIGAEGGMSVASRGLYPKRPVPMMRATLFTHDVVDSALEDERAHVWLGVGALCMAHLRGDKCVLVILWRPPDDITGLHERSVEYLKERSGLWLRPSPEKTQEAAVALEDAALGRFYPGIGNIALAGEAAGFLNPPLEGMSAALETGALAGQAVAEALKTSVPLAERYRDLLKPVMLRSTDQWQPLRLLFASPHEVDLKAAFRKIKDDDQYAIGSDIVRHMRAAGMGFLARLAMRGVFRQIAGRY